MTKQIKRILGIVLATLGVLGTLLLFGIFIYIVAREWLRGDISTLFRNKEFYYIFPIFMFLLPALYFIRIGRRLIRDEKVGILATVEILVILSLGSIIIYLNQSADSDYVDRSKSLSNLLNASPEWENTERQIIYQDLMTRPPLFPTHGSLLEILEVFPLGYSASTQFSLLTYPDSRSALLPLLL